MIWRIRTTGSDGDLYNSSQHMKAEFNSFVIHSNYY